jgi:hypothetical protein
MLKHSKMPKRLFILLLLVLGLLATPWTAYVDAQEAKKASCCASHAKERDCCKGGCNHQDADESCEGSCGNIACQSPSPSIGIIISNFIQIESFFEGYSLMVQGSSLQLAFSLTDFYAVWAPPKIG